MSKEYDDELDRTSGQKGRSRARNSEHGPSGDDYYLDDDFTTTGYDDRAGDAYGRQQAGRPKRRPAEGAQEGGRSAAGGVSRDAAGQTRGAGAGSTQGGSVRASGTGSAPARPVRNAGSNPAQDKMAGRPSGNGQPQGRTARPAGTASGDARTQGTAANGARTQGTAANGVRAQGTGRSRQSGGSGSRRPEETVSRTAASRSAAQAAKKKKVRRAVIMAVAEVLTLICIGFYSYALRINNSVNRPNNFDENKVKNIELTADQSEHMKGYWTIAVFGVDSRDGNVHKGTNTDVIMLCNINRDTGEIRLVSVFRDTYLNINDNGTYNKINSAYANGGAVQALAALNRNLDLDIKDYVTFNWKAVADGINMLGGVEGIDISKAEFRYINSFITETVQKTGVPSVQLKSAGVQHLDGVQAVAYGRLRLMDTDYARTERQRLIIQKAFEKAKQADLGLLNRILLMEVEQVETSLKFSDLTNLILDIGKYHIGETGGFPFARDAMTIGKKGDCVIPQTLESNVSELHKFLYDKENYDPTAMVKKISAKISADSGMYKKGVSVDHVPTDQGYIPKETEPVRTTSEETSTVDEREAASEGESIEETDENGDVIRPTRPGESTADGSYSTRPGESTAAGTRPTNPGESTADGSRPTRPGETTSGGSSLGPGETTAAGTNPTRPGESTSAGSNPSRPGETTDGMKPSSPGDRESTGSSDASTGPGVNPTTPHESTTAPPETTSSGPGGSPGPGGGSVQPGTSGADDVFTVPPPNAA